MDLRQALTYISDAGYPIAAISKKIGKDPSTLGKWMRGTSHYLSEQTQRDTWREIAKIKEYFEKIEIEEE